MVHPGQPNLYYAASLFNPEELHKNLRVVHGFEGLGYFAFLPQRDGVLFRQLVQEGVSVEEATRQVRAADVPALRSCHVLVADLNGAVMDACTVGEAAYANALGKTCIGWKTDARVMLPTGNNPMLTAWFHEIFSSEEELFDWAARYSRDFARRRVT